MDNGKQPPLTVVDNVKELKQPLTQAETALALYNEPENLANVNAQAGIDAHFAKVRYDAFIAQGFSDENAMLLVVEGYGGYSS